MASRAGLKAVDMFEAIGDGRIKALWIMATNPLVSLPDADRARDALAACPFVVVSDCVVGADTVRAAHVLLPATTWGEKDGTVTNSERRISRQRAFLPAPGEARADWRIICDVAKGMGFAGFDFASPGEIFAEHAALSAFENEGARDFDLSALVSLDAAGYDALAPVQWPVNARHPTGRARLFAEGGFFTGDRRARLRPIMPRPPRNATSRDYPLILNTGRVRDHWHTMTRTGKSARLSQHIFEPFAEVHPDDARREGLEDGALARLVSAWGAMIARVRVAPEQRRGCVFAPMHWSGAFAADGRVNGLVNPVVDPISGQPESKHTPIRAEPYIAQWHAFAMTRRRAPTPETGYWVEGAGADNWRIELAGDTAPADWDAWARARLGAHDEGLEWIAYRDSGAGHYRYASVGGGRLMGCVFIAPDHRLAPREWLAGLFEAERLTSDDRLSLLAGRPRRAGDDKGPIVCACLSVGRNQIGAAIGAGAASVEAIGARTKAGTNCGSCKPEIGKMLAQAGLVAAA